MVATLVARPVEVSGVAAWQAAIAVVESGVVASAVAGPQAVAPMEYGADRAAEVMMARRMPPPLKLPLEARQAVEASAEM